MQFFPAARNLLLAFMSSLVMSLVLADLNAITSFVMGSKWGSASTSLHTVKQANDKVPLIVMTLGNQTTFFA